MDAFLAILQAFPWFGYLLMVVLGGVFGSFITCAAYRVPRGISLRNPKYSQCPSCNVRLGIVDLIPVLSWIFLRGRCRRCHAPFGMRYVLIEITCVLIGLLSWHFIGLTLWLPFVFFILLLGVYFMAVRITR